MGFRFRKSIRLIPGVRLNFGKKGSSLSVGAKGFTTNYSSKGVRNTVSLPGTGISYTTYQKHGARQQVAPTANSTGSVGKAIGVMVLVLVIIAIIVAIAS